MRPKQLFAAFLAGACVFSLCACGNANVAPPTQNEYIETQDSISELFNSALQKLSEADSYTMIGSITSAAEIASSDVLTTVRTPLECRYQDGRIFFDSDSTNDPHTTYFDGERYYYELPLNDTIIKYFVTTNDHNDYLATEYLSPVDAEIILNPQLSVNDDGITALSFDMPFAIYESPGMMGWLGFVVDESFAANFLSVSATIDADGYFTHFTISFLNDASLGEMIHQEIAVDMNLSNYNSTVVTPPADLSAYEDWSEPEVPESTHGMLPLTPEDLG